MKKISAGLIALALLVGMTLAGCTNHENMTDESAAVVTTTLPTKDRSGKEISLPENASKIVSLVPSITEVLADLEKKDQLIAVDTHSAGMIQELEELPQMDMMAVDAEQLIAMNPEVVYISDINSANGDNVWQQVENAGISVVNVPTSISIAAIKEDVQFIADSLSESEKGHVLVEKMNQDIDEIANIGKTISNQKTVLFEVAAMPDIYSFGSETFLNEMIEMIGAKNVFVDQTGWLPVTEEAAIAAKPDVFLTNSSYLPDPVQEILTRKNWENVPAVQNEAVYEIDNPSSSLSNHHIIKALKQMAKAVYPEEYQDLTDE